MPRISAFYGITIWMYWNEGAHARPHFHARYAVQTASVDFAGAVIAGSLPGGVFEPLRDPNYSRA